ncbi:FecR family protein [Steroidobacter cummioxidans]|uniref:FecR family protein n=1 Tax=Steroidobacter cummioxidans TaxID=1803913 RepID=UPI000E3165F9|nr:FecR domain-containing protein [Steroidobacter cummioxidans]
MTTDESKLCTGSAAEQAAYWFRVLEDQQTPQRLAAFTRWIEASPRNIKEFCLAQEVDNCLQEFLGTCAIDIDQLMEQARQDERAKRRRIWGASFAASIVLLSVASLALIDRQRVETTYTATYEPRFIKLDDKSEVDLNAQSVMRVAFSRGSRDVYLEEGEGIFDVRHDPRRPFRVHARKMIFEALGTQFDVRMEQDQTVMSVINGVVQAKPRFVLVKALSDPAGFKSIPKVTAGFSLVLDQSGRAAPLKRFDVAAATEWRPRLVFNYQSLAAIAEEFNRHNMAMKLRIEGQTLRERRFSISFRDSDPQSLINYLARDESLEFVYDANEIIIRERNQ